MENQTTPQVASAAQPVSSGNPVNGWYKATVPRRWIASIIDTIIVVIPFLIIFVALGMIDGGSFQIIFTLILWSYNVLFIWKGGATLGKKLLKIQVVNTDYKPVSLGQALLRETLGKFLSNLIFALGYLWAIWDKNRQTWHDKIAGTYVVTKIPNDGKHSRMIWILIGLFLAIPIIAILAAVVVIVINPLELTKRSRDAARLTDFTSIQQALNVAGQEVSPDDSNFFCGGQQPPCEGKSSVDGKGWIKVDLSKVKNVGLIIPVDPTNNGENYYRYCSDGVNWEINAKLESTQQKGKAFSDDGDDPNVYEIGSDLTLCVNIIPILNPIND